MIKMQNKDAILNGMAIAIYQGRTDESIFNTYKKYGFEKLTVTIIRRGWKMAGPPQKKSAMKNLIDLGFDFAKIEKLFNKGNEKNVFEDLLKHFNMFNSTSTDTILSTKPAGIPITTTPSISEAVAVKPAPEISVKKEKEEIMSKLFKTPSSIEDLMNNYKIKRILRNPYCIPKTKYNMVVDLIMDIISRKKTPSQVLEILEKERI